MIPKIIHYVWVGGNELDDMAKRCIASWKKYCPDYEIIQWNESNFDIDSFRFARDAYEAKKFAHVSDVIRLYALVKRGGIYLDTDVEILKPLDCLLDCNAFIGFENESSLATCLIACREEFEPIKKLLEEYHNRVFCAANLEPNNKHFGDFFSLRGLKFDNNYQVVDGVMIYPSEFFCPKGWGIKDFLTTNNTYAVHHFSASWVSKEKKLISAYYVKYGRKRGRILFTLRHPILANRIRHSNKRLRKQARLNQLNG